MSSTSLQEHLTNLAPASWTWTGLLAEDPEPGLMPSCVAVEVAIRAEGRSTLVDSLRQHDADRLL